MARRLAAIAFTLACLHASSLMALGLGEIKLESFLNEPLRASIDLVNMGGLHAEEIKVRLGTSDDFDRLGLERAYFLTSIKFEVSDSGNGGARIILSSDEAVLEPYLDFIVEARWPSGRLLREYTVLVDPPVFSQSSQVVSASQRVEEVEGIAAPAVAERAAASGAQVDEDDPAIGNWGTTESSDGGTRVQLRDSDLPPGAMPQRNYNAATSPAPAPGSRYMIARDQTLWAIASRAKPAGASVHQTMLDIKRLNPDAFINGNINRIKAGYIIYLPTAEDISSADVSSTVAEVREQNAAYSEGRDGQLNATKPSLRISAETEESADTAADSAKSSVADGQTEAVDKSSTVPGSTAAETGDAAPVATVDADQRLAAIEEQLATLQRIVSLKDDQIAALQSALANAGVATAANGEAPVATAVGAPAATPEIAANEPVQSVPAADGPAAIAPDLEAKPEAEPQAQPGPKLASAAAEAQKSPPAPPKKPVQPEVSETTSDSSWTGYLLYVLGALVLVGLGGFMFSQRRKNAEQDTERNATLREDVFSDVRLKDQSINLESPEREIEEQGAAVSRRDNRGYGERKHDEYASDIDAPNAIAEADIYIAYGRHQQAIDLLKVAVASESGNPVYRLKLLEIYTELNNQSAADAQLAQIRASGDADSIARAETLMKSLHADDEPEPPRTIVRSPSASGLGLSPNPLAMMPDTNTSLEADFSGLEIEDRAASIDDDLDFSGDFNRGHSDGSDDEELVIAADSNGLSTKLDLARAYLDMGDDDGARQILDEVVAEGSEQLKAEARALLNRIGG
jgi:pilus assembly protein FimV